MKNISYHRAKDLVRRKLKTINDLKSFCSEHNIHYASCLNIKNNKLIENQYPFIIQKLLVLFGYGDVAIKKKYYFNIK